MLRLSGYWCSGKLIRFDTDRQPIPGQPHSLNLLAAGRAALESGIGDSVIRVNWPIPTDLVVKTTDFNSQNESLTRVIN